MRGMPEIKASKSTELDLRKDIAEREVLIGSMVGTLYPSIVFGEIQELKGMITDLKYNNHDHEFYTPEDFTPEEIGRKNVLAVACITENRKICKRCGYESC